MCDGSIQSLFGKWAFEGSKHTPEHSRLFSCSSFPADVSAANSPLEAVEFPLRNTFLDVSLHIGSGDISLSSSCVKTIAGSS